MPTKKQAVYSSQRKPTQGSASKRKKTSKRPASNLVPARLPVNKVGLPVARLPLYRHSTSEVLRIGWRCADIVVRARRGLAPRMKRTAQVPTVAQMPMITVKALMPVSQIQTISTRVVSLLAGVRVDER